jgi:hypothetical protein
MELNKLITESIQMVIAENKKEKQKTSVEFGGNESAGIKDQNVENKNQADLEGGLKSDIDKENKNPQGEGGKDAIPAAQKNPKLTTAVVAGMIGANKKGLGAKNHINKNIKFTPPAPATK